MNHVYREAIILIRAVVVVRKVVRKIGADESCKHFGRQEILLLIGNLLTSSRHQ